MKNACRTLQCFSTTSGHHKFARVSSLHDMIGLDSDNEDAEKAKRINDLGATFICHFKVMLTDCIEENEVMVIL